jgi:hypothetical protein
MTEYKAEGQIIGYLSINVFRVEFNERDATLKYLEDFARCPIRSMLQSEVIRILGEPI